jgi:hypothetical protein
MPYTFARLIEDGFEYTGYRKHCRECGMWIYCFAKRGKVRWLNVMDRPGDETIYQDHDTWICSGRRGRQKTAKQA